MATQENGFIDLFCDETPYSITDVTNTVVLNTQVAVEFRQPAGCNCAGRKYTPRNLSKAVAKAMSGGANGYPHKYHDHEGSVFSACSGTLYEYPILQELVYSGGGPGADRVIYDESSRICACLTHTGALKSGFVECKMSIKESTSSNATY